MVAGNMLVDNDSLVESLSFLKRDNLDILQLVGKRFRGIIEERTQGICLRIIERAELSGPDNNGALYKVMVEHDNHSVMTLQSFDLYEVATFLFNSIRFSNVQFLQFDRIPLTEQLSASILRSRWFFYVNSVIFDVNVSAASVPLFRTILLMGFPRMSVLSLNYCTNVTAEHVNDKLLNGLAQLGVSDLVLPEQMPISKTPYFNLSEDAILNFCFRSVSERPVELHCSHISVSPRFFEKLVEANNAIRSTAKFNMSLQMRNTVVRKLDVGRYMQNIARQNNYGYAHVLFKFFEGTESSLEISVWPHEERLDVRRPY
jgi:hypothetical protein